MPQRRAALGWSKLTDLDPQGNDVDAADSLGAKLRGPAVFAEGKDGIEAAVE